MHIGSLPVAKRGKSRKGTNIGREYFLASCRTLLLVCKRQFISSLLCLTCSTSLAEGSLKESRQKRLVVKHRKYNLNIAILQYFIDTATTITRLSYFGGINLDFLNSRNPTMYVPARPKGNLTPPRTYFSGTEADQLWEKSG